MTARPYRQGAGLALLGLAGLGAGLAFVARLDVLGFCLGVAVAGYFRVQPSVAAGLCRIVGGLVLVAALALFQALSDGPIVGIGLFLRFATLIAAAHLITDLWSSSEICDALVAGLRPFERLGLVDADRAAFMLMLTLRFVPDLIADFHEIRDAQSLRGRGRSVTALVVPLGVRALLRAEQVAEAASLRVPISPRPVPPAGGPDLTPLEPNP